jgi:thioredoxin 1
MASERVQALNSLNFDEVVARATGPVLVDFTAAWCGPCKAQAKVLDRLAVELEDVTIATVDVDDCPDLTARFGIRGMPTLLAFHDGRETGRRLGLTDERGVRALVPNTRGR